MNIDARLENWGEALRWRHRAGLANNIYGWGKTSGRFSAAQSAPSTRPIIDAPDAWLIEQAVCTVPLFYHFLLKYWYVRKYAEQHTLRLAGRHSGTATRRPTRMDWLATLGAAHALVSEALGRPAVFHKERAQALVDRLLWQDEEAERPSVEDTPVGKFIERFAGDM